MKVKFEKYNPGWGKVYEKIRTELIELTGFLNPEIAHIGSTSVEGLSAKPIIDILIGLKSDKDLEKIIAPLMDKNYVYYEKYNKVMPYRRFLVKYKISPQSLPLPGMLTDKDEIPANTNEHHYRIAHIHVLPYHSEHWIRHIAFRDYLRTHPIVKSQYQKLKERLSIKEWADGNEYNRAKASFLKAEEQKAINWKISGKIEQATRWENGHSLNIIVPLYKMRN